MVDISTAQQQIEQSRSQIAAARQQSETLKAENQSIRDKLSNARSQILSPRSMRSGNINTMLLRKKQLQAIGLTEEQIAEREKTIAEYESDIAKNETAVNEYENYVRDYIRRQEKESQQPEVTVKSVEQSLQMSLSPELRNKIETELKKSNYKYSDDLANRLNDVLNQKIKQPEIIQIKDIQPLQQQSFTEPVSVVSNAMPTTFLGKLKDKTRTMGTIGEILAPPVELGSVVATTIRHPFKSLKSMATSGGGLAKQTGLFLVGKAETPFASVGDTLRDRPAYSTSYVATNILALKGVNSVSKVPKALGYPKLSTFVKSVPTETEGESIFLATTKQKNLLSNKNYWTLGKATVKTKPDGSNLIYASDIKGITRESNIVIPTGKRQLSSKFYVGSREFGVVESKPVTVKIDELQSQSIPESFTIQSTGVSRSKRILKGVDTEIQQQKYATFGIGGEVNENSNFLLSKSIPYSTKKGKQVFSKSGRGYTLGYFDKNVPDTNVMIQSGNKAFTQKNVMSEVSKQQIIQSVDNALKTNSKPVSVKVPFLPKGQTTTTIATETPTVRPEIMQSQYYGTGQYEQTSGVLSPILSQPKKQDDFTYNIDSQIMKSDTRQDQRLRLRQKQLQDDVLTFKENVIPRETIDFIQTPKPRLDQASEFKQTQKTNQKPIPQPVFMTPKPIITFPKNNNQSQRKSGIRTFLSKFDIFVRRKGQDKKVGSESDLFSARKRLKNYLKSDLSASGFIESNGDKVNTAMLGLDREFTSAKRDQFRLVQKRGFRLGSGSERNEIQLFKRIKLKKKRMWW